MLFVISFGFFFFVFCGGVEVILGYRGRDLGEIFQGVAYFRNGYSIEGISVAWWICIEGRG